MSEAELSLLIKPRHLPADQVVIEADAAARQALAERFGLASIERLHAALELTQQTKAIAVAGTLSAEITQLCAVSGEAFPVTMKEQVALRFVAQGDQAQSASQADDVEIELAPEDCDEIEYSGDAFDLGEAIAQSLGLAIDPYAEGPQADSARKSAGIVAEGEQEGPLAAALAALKQDG